VNISEYSQIKNSPARFDPAGRRPDPAILASSSSGLDLKPLSAVALAKADLTLKRRDKACLDRMAGRIVTAGKQKSLTT
jgi:hypothetical protein